MKYIGLISIFLLALVCKDRVIAQQTGKAPDAAIFDTTYIFVSPRPLIADSLVAAQVKYQLGLNILISGYGYGAGFFYKRNISNTWSLFADLAVSGARNTDEQEYYDPYTNSYRVPGKVNRLFLFPLTFGAQYRMFAKSLDESFIPYLYAGIGPAFILATPYDREFFNSFGNGALYSRLGGFVGAGATIGAIGRNVSGVSMRYYVIPFGGEGLESIRSLPITDFGGLFIAISIGWSY